jgi:hypothetical protein
MSAVPEEHRAGGLDRIEKILFLFGVFAFALLMLMFGDPFGEGGDLPIVIVWIVLGIGFVFWLDRHLARQRR